MSYMSHKQRWRRLRTPSEGFSILGTANSDLYAEYISLNRTKSCEANLMSLNKDKTSPHRVRSNSASAKSVSTNNLRGILGLRVPRGILKKNGTDARGRANKRVKFDTCVHVFLVAGRRDFNPFTKEIIWWSNEDISKFRERATTYWKLHGRDTFEEASSDVPFKAEHVLKDIPLPPLDISVKDDLLSINFRSLSIDDATSTCPKSMLCQSANQKIKNSGNQAQIRAITFSAPTIPLSKSTKKVIQHMPKTCSSTYHDSYGDAVKINQRREFVLDSSTTRASNEIAIRTNNW